MKDEDMPVDASGNRAECIMDDQSTIKRMNLGRLYEQVIHASMRTVQLNVQKIIQNKSEASYNEAYEYLMDFYRTVSPRMHDAVVSSAVESRKKEHVEDVAKNGVYLYTPTDTPKAYPDVIRELRRKFPPTYGPIEYRGKSGRWVRTKKPVMIGGMYMVLLEKIGNTWGAVSSSRVQHLGIPAKLTNNDKYSSPGREQPVKIFGEAEIRLTTSTIDPKQIADLMDQSNNPRVHRHVIENILLADKPTNITNVVDRRKFPSGEGRVVAYVRHMLACGGIRFVRGNP